MKLKRILASALVATAVTAGGLSATPSPAMAVGGCPSGKLCLYAGTNFTQLAVTSASTSACVYFYRDFKLGNIASYVNNLPVKVYVYNAYDPYAPALQGTISPGGFSSNAGYFGYHGATCTGTADLGVPVWY